jgi:hypothetical protein
MKMAKKIALNEKWLATKFLIKRDVKKFAKKIERVAIAVSKKSLMENLFRNSTSGSIRPDNVFAAHFRLLHFFCFVILHTQISSNVKIKCDNSSPTRLYRPITYRPLTNGFLYLPK